MVTWAALAWLCAVPMVASEAERERMRGKLAKLNFGMRRRRSSGEKSSGDFLSRDGSELSMYVGEPVKGKNSRSVLWRGPVP